MEIVCWVNAIWVYVDARFSIREVMYQRKRKPLTYFKVGQTALESFDLNTWDLTEHDRHDLIMDYFEKIQVLLAQDVEHLSKAVQEIDPKEKVEIARRMKRMRKSQELLYDLDYLTKEYKKGGGRD